MPSKNYIIFDGIKLTILIDYYRLSVYIRKKYQKMFDGNKHNPVLLFGINM